MKNRYDESFWSPEAIAQRKEDRELDRWYRRKMREQKLMGAGMVALNLICPTGAAVLLIPLGLWLMFSKEVNIY